MEFEKLTEPIIGAALAVHRELGPGLLESTYAAGLVLEFRERGLRFERQWPVPVLYKGQSLDCRYRADFLIEDKVILEIKSVQHLEPIHTAQLVTYVKLSGRPVGLLINFNVELLREGIKRVLNPAILRSLRSSV